MALAKNKLSTLREKIEAPVEVKTEIEKLVKKSKVKKEETPEEKSNE